MKESNLNNFLKVLDVFVGGKTRQTILIMNQISLALSSIVDETLVKGKIAQEVRLASMKLSKLGGFDERDADLLLQNSFWNAHLANERDTFQKFEVTWPADRNINLLSGPIKELDLYLDFVSSEKEWESEEEKIILTGEALVRRYFRFLLEKNKEMFPLFLSESLAAKSNNCSWYDWFLIFDSILVLLSSNCHFCHGFGKITTELRLSQYNALKITEQILDASDRCFHCYNIMVPRSHNTSTILECYICNVVYVNPVPHNCIRCSRSDHYDYDRYGNYIL